MYSGGSHEKVIDAVAAMAWPVIQASITTTLGTIGLIMVPSYIVNAFFYTVVIVVGLGMFHSLAVLPVMLTLLSFDWSELCQLNLLHHVDILQQCRSTQKYSCNRLSSVLLDLNPSKKVKWSKNEHKIQIYIPKPYCIINTQEINQTKKH